MTRTEWLVDYIVDPCTCGDAYTSRDLVSPQCSRCNDGDSARDALLLAYQLGHDEAGQFNRDGRKIVESNREFLAALLKQMEAERFG